MSDKPIYSYPDEVARGWKQELERLKAENKRYREALESVEYWLSDISPEKMPCCFPKDKVIKALEDK